MCEKNSDKHSDVTVFIKHNDKAATQIKLYQAIYMSSSNYY